MSEPSKSAERGVVVEVLATVTRPARRAARAVAHRLERLRHTGRRERATMEVRTRGPIESILFICLGNICRSPYAEHRLRTISTEGDSGSTGPGRTIESAGFILPGRPSPDVAQEVARRRGLDLSAHRSRTITREMLRRFDLVVVMTEEQLKDLRRDFEYDQAIHLGDLDPGPISTRDIPDPYGKEDTAFAEVFARIDRTSQELWAVLEERKIVAGAERRLK